MFKIPLPELKEKIVSTGKLSPEQLDIRIKEKINELSGLITEEGAAHIIANELGIELFQAEGKLKIKGLYSGMRNIMTVGKVVQKFEVREFQKEDRTGKVCSLILGDETGTIRVVFWNDQVDQLQNVTEDTILMVKGAYVRDNRGVREVHLGENGTIEINPAGEAIGVVRRITGFQRTTIQQLQGSEEGIEILGTVVQVFDPRFFFLCPQCNKKVNEVENEESGDTELKFQCATHGVVRKNISYVLNAVMDDGTGTIRSVFWKNQINHLLNKSEQEMVQYKDNIASFEDIKTDLLGEQFKLMGRVKKNEMFNRLEFNVQMVEKANAEEELKRLEKG